METPERPDCAQPVQSQHDDYFVRILRDLGARQKMANEYTRSLKEQGQFPGVYAQEEALIRSMYTKALGSTALVGVGLYLGMRALIPKGWGMTRAVATALGMSIQLVAGGLHFVLEGTYGCLQLEHSVFADVACPAMLEVVAAEKERMARELEQQRYILNDRELEKMRNRVPGGELFAEAARLCRQRQFRSAAAGGLSDGGVFSGANGKDAFTVAGTTERLKEGAWHDRPAAPRPGGAGGEWTDAHEPWVEQQRKR